MSQRSAHHLLYLLFVFLFHPIRAIQSPTAQISRLVALASGESTPQLPWSVTFSGR